MLPHKGESTMAKKITSAADLKNLQERVKDEIDLRTGPKDMQITVHMGTCGIAAGARDVLVQLADELGRASVDTVTLRQSGCMGLCDQEPMLTLTDRSGKSYVYGKLNKEKVDKIVHEHVLGGNPVTHCMVKT
jgi:NADP-reducing hydrogenase subunit HndB